LGKMEPERLREIRTNLPALNHRQLNEH